MVDTRLIKLAHQYADLRRLRRELFLAEEKLRGLAIENATKSAIGIQRSAAQRPDGRTLAERPGESIRFLYRA
jgi:hypothetical protein